jgi:uncharacterized membrane protein YfhO
MVRAPTIDSAILFLLFLFLLTFWPFEVFCLFSLLSNLLVFRFLLLFFETAKQHGLSRNESRGPAQTCAEPLD